MHRNVSQSSGKPKKEATRKEKPSTQSKKSPHICGHPPHCSQVRLGSSSQLGQWHLASSYHAAGSFQPLSQKKATLSGTSSGHFGATPQVTGMPHCAGQAPQVSQVQRPSSSSQSRQSHFPSRSAAPSITQPVLHLKGGSFLKDSRVHSSGQSFGLRPPSHLKLSAHPDASVMFGHPPQESQSWPVSNSSSQRGQSQ